MALSSAKRRLILGTGAGNNRPLPKPLVLDLFTSTASYSAGSNLTASLDTPLFPGVANSMKLVTTAVGSGQGITGAKTLALPYNPDTDFGDTIAFMFSCDRYATNQVQFEIGRSSSFSGVTISVNSEDVAQGSKWVAFPKSAWTSMPSGMGPIQLRPRYSTRVPSNAEVKYQAIAANCKGQPTMVLTLDDCHRSHYSIVFPFFRDEVGKDAHFTFNVANDLVGTPNKYNVTECQEMYAAGHLAACDSPNDFTFFFWTDIAGACGALGTVQQWLIDNNMPRGRFYGCYPEGLFMATATDPAVAPNKSVRSSTIVATGTNTIDVGTLITANPAGTVVEIGMKMFGGFGAAKVNGATVTNVVGTTITLDQTINAALTRAVFINLDSVFTAPALPNAFRDNNGIRMFRTTLGGGTSGSAGYLPQFTRFGFGDQAQQFPGQGYTGGVLANMILDLQKVAAVGGTIMPYFHNVVTGTPVGLDTSFQDVFRPYILAARDLGFKFLNMEELDQRDSQGYRQLLAA